MEDLKIKTLRILYILMFDCLNNFSFKELLNKGSKIRIIIIFPSLTLQQI